MITLEFRAGYLIPENDILDYFIVKADRHDNIGWPELKKNYNKKTRENRKTTQWSFYRYFSCIL